MRSCSRLVACAVVALAASPCLAFQVPGPAVWRRPRVAFRCARMTAGQSVACEQILLSFEPEKYEAPLWARNQHVNTIVGALFATPPKPQYRRERWNTPDGDFLDIDWLDSQAGFSRGVVLLYHGLESTTSAPLTVRQAFALVEQGFDVAAVCFRGCSGEPNRTPGAYHLGFTQDIRYIAETLHEQSPDRKIFLSGTSLGGNVMTKLLGELGDDARDLGICGGAVACVPMNALQCQPQLDTNSFNRKVYSGNFLKSLKPKAELQHTRFPDRFDIERVRAASTLGDFDEAFIAPVYGFKDKEDYYTQSGSGRFLHKVRVPHYIMNALDDPFIDRKSLPTPADIGSGTVRLVYTQHGGHCGYIQGLRSLSVCWRALFSKVLQGKRVEAAAAAPNGYLPEELARFLAHVDHCTGGRAPTRSGAIARGNNTARGGMLGSLVALVACARRYLAVLLPRLAGRVTKTKT